MIDFSSAQLTWIVLGACSMGGTGYLTMNNKVDEIDKKLAISINNTEHASKSMDLMQQQLNRIEEKLDKPVAKR
ncbi:hypothetical protein UFOVP623_38 [uncultured Caudovirales phage]|uniref:Uncharacterized protein n=1 Tax=uncultured Caudovirales phage TaxID=2100421 RepID=A0A6J5N8G0_9CAUD|nr:hypothetical protein UFOVP623_38 [uncultured Caudovirales phage]